MMWRWLVLLPTIALLSPGLVRAQEDTKKFDPFKPNASNNGTMYEDIEIFRRILDRKLEPCYLQISFEGSDTRMEYMLGMEPRINKHNDSLWFEMGGPVWITPEGTQYNQLIAPLILDPVRSVYTTGRSGPWIHREASHTLEGVYLPGQGVLYTATLSSLQLPSKAAKSETTTKPVSEWERVRRQLRNEKEEPKKPEAKKPPLLSDLLLKVLAENGHHFSQLGENESLTIVLTVRGANPSPPTRQSAKETKKTTSQTRREDANSDVSSKVRDLELLGDLHMKQEHYGQARDAFRNAMELEPDRQKKAALARKLAQAYLMLSDIEEARAALDQALALTKETADKKDKPAPRVKPSAALPVKLIISAPKKLLDQVKEGKITFEEFRAKAHVETLRFQDSRAHE